MYLYLKYLKICLFYLYIFIFYPYKTNLSIYVYSNISYILNIYNIYIYLGAGTTLQGLQDLSSPTRA